MLRCVILGSCVLAGGMIFVVDLRGAHLRVPLWMRVYLMFCCPRAQWHCASCADTVVASSCSTMIKNLHGFRSSLIFIYSFGVYSINLLLQPKKQLRCFFNEPTDSPARRRRVCKYLLITWPVPLIPPWRLLLIPLSAVRTYNSTASATHTSNSDVDSAKDTSSRREHRRSGAQDHKLQARPPM